MLVVGASARKLVGGRSKRSVFDCLARRENVSPSWVAKRGKAVSAPLGQVDIMDRRGDLISMSMLNMPMSQQAQQQAQMQQQQQSPLNQYFVNGVPSSTSKRVRTSAPGNSSNVSGTASGINSNVATSSSNGNSLGNASALARLSSLSGPNMLRRRKSLTGYSPREIIMKKRDGMQLSAAEIEWFIKGFHEGHVESYQMSAFLMAVCTRGMTNLEAADMTKAMVKSGQISDLSLIRPGSPKVDKHSSGGIGDKVSLVLAPLVACFDIVVPMMSGRGLGHTGGTLDKVDSIPGLQTNLTTEQYMNQLEQVGCAIVAPMEDFCPVEKSMYEIRDVSGCVEDVALVASSIMSKKLSENPDALLLDVKMGRGAFAKCMNDAAALASMMVSIGDEAGIDTCCLLTNMNAPLGSAVGNALEVREAVQILSGSLHNDATKQGSAFKSCANGGSMAALMDVRQLALSQAAIMLGLAGKASSFEEGYEMASHVLDSGKALARFADMVTAQGGDSSVLFDIDAKMPLSREKLVFRAPEDVIVQDIDAFEIGMASTTLGAGRRYADDIIDYHAGLVLHAKIGEVVKKGDPVFTVYVGDDQDKVEQRHALGDPQRRLRDGFERSLGAVKLAPNRPEFMTKAPPIIEYFVDRSGVQPFNSLRY